MKNKIKNTHHFYNDTFSLYSKSKIFMYLYEVYLNLLKYLQSTYYVTFNSFTATIQCVVAALFLIL